MMQNNRSLDLTSQAIKQFDIHLAEVNQLLDELNENLVSHSNSKKREYSIPSSEKKRSHSFFR
jgi:hypothetical protein